MKIKNILAVLLIAMPALNLAGQNNDDGYPFEKIHWNNVPGENRKFVNHLFLDLKFETNCGSVKKLYVFSHQVQKDVSIALMGSGGSWIKVSDDCGKCKITSTEYTCGKCGSGMSSSSKWDNKQEYMIYTFKCNDRKKKNCTHTCQFKCKPN